MCRGYCHLLQLWKSIYSVCFRSVPAFLCCAGLNVRAMRAAGVRTNAPYQVQFCIRKVRHIVLADTVGVYHA
jgi:hypothetical protein